MKYTLTQKLSEELVAYIDEKINATGFTGAYHLHMDRETEVVTLNFEKAYDRQANEIDCDFSVIPNQDDLMADFDAFKTDWVSPTVKKANLRASAKAKLVAGEALTEDEASVLVLE